MPDVVWSADVHQAEWIRDRLGPFESGEVTSVVPGGFEAYARVLHPAHDSAGRPHRWSEVASRNGIEPLRDAHFAEIALVPPGQGARVWEIVGPQEGTLGAAEALALVDILAGHCASPGRSWFCLWDGYGWGAGSSSTMSFPDRGETWLSGAMPGVYQGADGEADPTQTPVDPGDPVPRDVRSGPRVALPHRDYLLYRGGLDAALVFLESEQQTPNLWWPEDRAWCLGSELDLGWTYIGGSQDLINHLVRDDRVEVWLAETTDSHHLRLPPWLTRAVDDAVSQVMEGQPGRVQTQLGTVTATARRPRGRRHGHLETTTERLDGSAQGSGWSSLSRGDVETLRHEIRHQLSWAVLGLLG